MINNKIFEKINEELFPKLENIDCENKPFAVGFSGIPGAGKTSISIKIEDKYKGVRVSSKEIRNTINKLNLTNNPGETEDLLQDYTFNLLANFPFKNKLIILDKSLDREYPRFFEVCDSNNLKYFIIRMDFSEEEAIERILNREEIDENDLRTRMKKWVADYEDFGKNAKYDLLLEGKNPDIEKLYNELDRLLK